LRVVHFKNRSKLGKKQEDGNKTLRNGSFTFLYYKCNVTQKFECENLEIATKTWWKSKQNTGKM